MKRDKCKRRRKKEREREYILKSWKSSGERLKTVCQAYIKKKKKKKKRGRDKIADWLITCAKSSLHRHIRTYIHAYIYTHTYTYIDYTYTYIQLSYRCSCSRIANSLPADFSCSLLFAYLKKEPASVFFVPLSFFVRA